MASVSQMASIVYGGVFERFLTIFYLWKVWLNIANNGGMCTDRQTTLNYEGF